ncbi:DUF2784 domain-containing protein [Mucilaginibacter koreensis]
MSTLELVLTSIKVTGLRILEIFLTIFHLLIVGFNLLGWIWPATRKAHLVVVALTACCWLLLGMWFGIGYCPVTDWEWQVKEKLGERNLPNSFIKYYADKITGQDISASLVDTITAVCFFMVVVLAVYFNFFSKRKKLNINS